MTTPPPAPPRPLGWLPSRILLAGLLLSLTATVLLVVLNSDAFVFGILAMAGFGLLLTGLPAALFLFYRRRQPPPELPREARVSVWFSAVALVCCGVLLVGIGGDLDSLTDQVVGVVLGLVGIVTIVQAVRFKPGPSGGLRLASGRGSVVGAFLFLLVAVTTPKFACGCGTKGKAYLAAVKSDLRNLVTAQEAYFIDHHRYGTNADLSKSNEFFATSGVSIEIVVPDTLSWRAIGRHMNLPDQECAVWVGTRPPTGMHGAGEQEVKCWTN
jgi:hypothetical protein